MALGRFVVTSTLTLSPDAVATLVAGEPGTGGAAGFGNSATLATARSGKWLWGMTLLAGTVIYADSSAGSNGPQLLYQAIGAGNLRAFVDGQDAVGHAALSNLAVCAVPNLPPPTQRQCPPLPVGQSWCLVSSPPGLARLRAIWPWSDLRA